MSRDLQVFFDPKCSKHRYSDKANSDIFFDRELSWLDFNFRVIESSKRNQSHPREIEISLHY